MQNPNIQYICNEYFQNTLGTTLGFAWKITRDIYTYCLFLGTLKTEAWLGQ